MSELKVKEHQDWSRNQSGVLVNANINEYKTFIKKRQVIESKDEQIAALNTNINNIGEELQTLKELVYKLIQEK